MLFALSIWSLLRIAAGRASQDAVTDVVALAIQESGSFQSPAASSNWKSCGSSLEDVWNSLFADASRLTLRIIGSESCKAKGAHYHFKLV